MCDFGQREPLILFISSLHYTYLYSIHCLTFPARLLLSTNMQVRNTYMYIKRYEKKNKIYFSGNVIIFVKMTLLGDKIYIKCNYQITIFSPFSWILFGFVLWLCSCEKKLLLFRGKENEGYKIKVESIYLEQLVIKWK